MIRFESIEKVFTQWFEWIYKKIYKFDFIFNSSMTVNKRGVTLYLIKWSLTSTVLFIGFMSIMVTIYAYNDGLKRNMVQSRDKHLK